jgi:hypothetical protein
MIGSVLLSALEELIEELMIFRAATEEIDLTIMPLELVV